MPAEPEPAARVPSGDRGRRGAEGGVERAEAARRLGTQPALRLRAAGPDRVEVGRVGRQVAARDPGGLRRRPALRAARSSITTTRPAGSAGPGSAPARPPGPAPRAGGWAAARRTRAPVAAAMLTAPTAPSRASAPSTVGRLQCLYGTLPAARRLRGARA